MTFLWSTTDFSQYILQTRCPIPSVTQVLTRSGVNDIPLVAQEESQRVSLYREDNIKKTLKLKIVDFV